MFLDRSPLSPPPAKGKKQENAAKMGLFPVGRLNKSLKYSNAFFERVAPGGVIVPTGDVLRKNLDLRSRKNR